MMIYKKNLKDRYIDSNGFVHIDNHSDWKLLNSKEVDGYTVFQFKRNLITCDPNDRKIEVKSKIVYLLSLLFITNSPLSLSLSL